MSDVIRRATPRPSAIRRAGLNVVVIDYGMGNVRSVQRALERLGCKATISAERTTIEGAQALVLPGVGAFGRAMENLHARKLRDVLDEQVLRVSKPILGICLGMQLFADSSEEMGHHDGLGWIPGRVLRIDTKDSGLSLPHVGWSPVDACGSSDLFGRTPPRTHFYFDHTYHYACDRSFVVGEINYGARLTAAIRRDHIVGVQFHPEKSQTAGLKLIRSFLESIPVEGAKVAC